MTVIAYVAWIVCILGLIVFLAADKYPDAKKIGLVMFAAGLLVGLFSAIHHVVRF